MRKRELGWVVIRWSVMVEREMEIESSLLGGCYIKQTNKQTGGGYGGESASKGTDHDRQGKVAHRQWEMQFLT